jgi:hypothetical protein
VSRSLQFGCSIGIGVAGKRVDGRKGGGLCYTDNNNRKATTIQSLDKNKTISQSKTQDNNRVHPQGRIQAVSPRPSGDAKSRMSTPSEIQSSYPIHRLAPIRWAPTSPTSDSFTAGQGRAGQLSQVTCLSMADWSSVIRPIWRSSQKCRISLVVLSLQQVRKAHHLQFHKHHQVLSPPNNFHHRQCEQHRKHVRNNNRQRPRPHHSLLPSRLRPAPLPALRQQLLTGPSCQPPPRSHKCYARKPRELGGSLEQSAGVQTGAKPAGRDADDVYQ